METYAIGHQPSNFDTDSSPFLWYESSWRRCPEFVVLTAVSAGTDVMLTIACRTHFCDAPDPPNVWPALVTDIA